MNNQLSFSFQVSTSRFIKSATYTENGQKYLLFILSGIFLLSKETGWNPLLVVPDDNSPLTNQLKNLKVGEFASNYTTAFSNLKFLPKFHNFFEGAEYQEPEIRNGWLVKDTSQVQKLANNSYSEFTFKVINQFKGGHGKTKSGKRLSYQESFSTSGNYEHILEIEPVNLGIENFPPITRLVFEFAKPLNPGGPKPLRESHLYNNNILTNSVGKTFSMKIKNWWFGGGMSDYGFDTLYFASIDNLDWDSFQEKSTDNNLPTIPPPSTPPKNNNKGLIIGIIMIVAILSLIIGFLVVKKRK